MYIPQPTCTQTDSYVGGFGSIHLDSSAHLYNPAVTTIYTSDSLEWSLQPAHMTLQDIVGSLQPVRFLEGNNIYKCDELRLWQADWGRPPQTPPSQRLR